jgi:DNA-directed RNA polymerase subunit RPC12/RpoP
MTDIEDDLSRYIEYANDGTEKIDSKCGQWIYEDKVVGKRYYYCSNCTKTNDTLYETLADEDEVKWWKYCPRCGAKMQIKNIE